MSSSTITNMSAVPPQVHVYGDWDEMDSGEAERDATFQEERSKRTATHLRLERALFNEVWPIWMSPKNFQKVATYCVEYIVEMGDWTTRDIELTPEWIIRTSPVIIDPGNERCHAIHYNRLNVYMSLAKKYHLNITRRQLDSIPIRISEVFLYMMEDMNFYGRLLSVMWDLIRVPITN